MPWEWFWVLWECICGVWQGIYVVWECICVRCGCICVLWECVCVLCICALCICSFATRLSATADSNPHALVHPVRRLAGAVRREP